ncbi:hypothetical protein L596_018104 [Steinernema carpocapsae]|uniref:Uncharacterized protein n=1 Tax=Steinernema carpocapsae TaxID=34508 RepID=A0A4U5N3Z0_STECR|nr:hypothetical protein L596_018104 [Steinernema carpocapsae]
MARYFLTCLRPLPKFAGNSPNWFCPERGNFRRVISAALIGLISVLEVEESYILVFMISRTQSAMALKWGC